MDHLEELHECYMCKLKFTECNYWKHLYLDDCQNANPSVVQDLRMNINSFGTASSTERQIEKNAKLCKIDNEVDSNSDLRARNSSSPKLNYVPHQMDFLTSSCLNNVSSSTGIRRLDIGCNKYFCDFCEVSISDCVSVKQHENGRKHKNNASKRMECFSQLKSMDMKGQLDREIEFYTSEEKVRSINTSVSPDVSKSNCIDDLTNNNGFQLMCDTKLPATVDLPKTVPVSTQSDLFMHSGLSSHQSPSTTVFPQDQLKPILRNLCLTQLLSLLSDENSNYNQINQNESLNQAFISNLRLKCYKDLFNFIKISMDSDLSSGIPCTNDFTNFFTNEKVTNGVSDDHVFNKTLHNILILSWCHQLQILNKN